MILHLSDLHFGTEKIECINAIKKFCEQHQLEAVVVSGDLTQRARYNQFYLCKKFLDELNLPYLVVPGNHDIPLYNVWGRLFNPFSRYHLFFGNMEETLETEHFYIIGINSIRRRYHTKGHVSLAQIRKIDALLKSAPVNKIKIIAAHQPFYTPPDNDHGVNDCPVLGRMALERWSQNGLNALVHGHLHQSAVFDLNQIYQLAAPHPILEIHAGTAISYRLHQGSPNGFNVILNNQEVKHYIYSEKIKAFIMS